VLHVHTNYKLKDSSPLPQEKGGVLQGLRINGNLQGMVWQGLLLRQSFLKMS
jgi:hypothetical protein